MYPLSGQTRCLPSRLFVAQHLPNVAPHRRVTNCFRGNSSRSFVETRKSSLFREVSRYVRPNRSERYFSLESPSWRSRSEPLPLENPKKLPSLKKRTDEVYRALRNGEPHQILKVLSKVENKAIVATLPDSVFVSALLRLTPEHFLEPYIGISMPMNDKRFPLKGLWTTYELLKMFFRPMDQILRARRTGKHALGLVEYRHLLRISGSVGDLKTVVNLWRLMQSSGVEPDLQCYNYFLHACVWEQSVYGPERFRLRVSPLYYGKRSLGWPKAPHRGFGTAGRSVRKKAYAIILEMRKLNLPLDEDTYINMLLASARVGSRSGMNQVLISVWGVDVVQIAKKSPETLPAAKPLAGSSPLYPTPKLLWAVAHAYGCNSMLDEALRTITYISEQYGIEITEDVWTELFDRAFVLSRRRFGRFAKYLRLGQVDGDILFRLKDMLQLDGKANGMNVYRMLAKTARVKHRYRQFLGIIREAYGLLHKTREERNNALKLLEVYLGVSLQMVPSLAPPIEEFQFYRACSQRHTWRALRKYELLRLLVEQQQSLMEKMAEDAIRAENWMGGYLASEWSQRYLPKFIAEWKDFLPESYKVRLPKRGGDIEFIGRTTFADLNIRMHENEPVRWSECGSFVAEEGEQIQVSQRILWAHIRARLGRLVGVEPFRWFIYRGWRRVPLLSHGVDSMELESKEGNLIAKLSVNDDFDDEKRWGNKQQQEQHACYVTMEPLCALPPP